MDTATAPRRRWLTLLRWGAIALLVVVVVARLVARNIAAVPVVPAEVEQLAPAPVIGDAARLRLMTLNLAHGRADALNQVGQLGLSEDELRANIAAAAAVVARHDPDLVCLQEADSPSWWSGDFDHVAAVASPARLPYAVRANHVDGLGLHYGTAILSRWVLTEAEARTFDPTPPTFPKGFTIAAVQWPGRDLVFDLVSIHCDFASAGARERQIDQLVAVVRARGRPVIVGGDLNSGWSATGATRRLAEALALTTWEPEAELVTFPDTGARLDWILVSAPFELERTEILPDVISDHHALVATIGVTDPGRSK